MVARRVISEITAAFAEFNHFHWRSTDADRMHLAWGWWAQVCRLAYGMGVLWSARLEREAMPLFRSCLEYTLFLKALIDQGSSAVEAAYAKSERDRLNFLRDAQTGPMRDGITAEMLDLPVRATSPDAGWTQGVQAICEHYDAIGTVYPIYRQACLYGGCPASR